MGDEAVAASTHYGHHAGSYGRRSNNGGRRLSWGKEKGCGVTDGWTRAAAGRGSLVSRPEQSAG